MTGVGCIPSVTSTSALSAYSANTEPFYVKAKYSLESIDFTLVGMVDSGASHCLLPLSMIPDDCKKLLQPTNGSTTVGISGVPLTPVGEFVCNVSFATKKTTSLFYKILVQVFDTDMPPIIGRSIIRHPTVSHRETSDTNWILHRRLPNVRRPVKHHIPLCRSHGTIVGKATHIPARSDSLQEKLEWLKTKRSLVLPSDADTTEVGKVVDLLLEYNEVFGYEGKALGVFPHEVEIPTNGEAVSRKQHPIAEKFRSVIDGEIACMLKQGVIVPCGNPKGFNTPIMVVEKKNGKPRVCANFKNTLNKVLSTSADWCWQMPATEQSIDAIGNGNKYFSSLDLKSGYWQCKIQESDQHKTAFHWGNQCYMYTRLPFGLAVSGMIFSRCIAKALDEVSNKENVQTYIDDVLCYGKDFETYLTTLKQILQAAKTNGILLNPEKCNFLQKQVKFLGRIISEKGFTADPEYVEAIRHLPAPTTRRELQATIGRVVWMRHFIETRVGERVKTNNFATLIRELNKLNRKDTKFEWSREAHDAYETVKSRLASPPVIHFADFQKDFVLVTDASLVGCGAVLLQEHNGQEYPVAVASVTLSEREQRWSATEREAYGILWAVEKFSYFLKGRPFVVRTDHKSLTFLDQTSFANPKISRWQERLGQYQFVVQYIKGEENVFADLLSRPCGLKKTETDDVSKVAGKFYSVGESRLRVYVPSWCSHHVKSLTLLNDEQKVRMPRCFTAKTTLDTDKEQQDWIGSIHLGILQREDPYLSRVIECLENENKGCGKGLAVEMDESDHRGVLYKKFAKRFRLEPITKLLINVFNDQTRIVIPQSAYPHFLFRAHDETGHFGRVRMAEFLHDYWWPSQLDDITNYCNSCTVCCRRKGNYNRSAKQNTGHLLRGSKPFSVLYIDFVHMRPSQTGKKYILTVQCAFSRYFFAIPTNRDRAIDAANSLLREVILKFNCRPEVLSSDRGTHFTSSIMAELCKSYGIQHNLHTAWRPQSSGNIERGHRTLKNALFASCAERNCDWAETLPFIVNSMNVAHNAATSCSPYFTVFGQKPNLGLPVLPGKDVRSTEPLSYGMNIRLVLDRIHQIVEVSTKAADIAYENRVNKGGPIQKIDIGDMVYIKREKSAVAVRSKMPWVGTYRVIDTNQHVVRITDESGNTDWIHRHHILKHILRKPELERTMRFPVPPPTLDSSEFRPGSVSKPPESSIPQSRGPMKSTVVNRTVPEVPADTVENQAESQAGSESFVRRSTRHTKEPSRFGEPVAPKPRKPRKN